MPIQTTAELFRLTDDGSGGMVQTLKRRIKLHLRAWLERQPLQQVAQTLAHPELRCLPVFDPQLLLRPLRSYLWNGLNASQRAQAFSAHFAWLRHAFDETDIDTLYNLGRLEVCTMAAAPGCLDIALTPGRGLGREGELELHLSLNGVLLLRAAFCILPAELLEAGTTAPGGRVMVIGSVQGCAGRAEGMRALTHATHRSRPKALLLDVLQGLSAGLHIDALLGVSTRSHVYGRYHSLSKRVGVDYDQMWQELGATQRLGHHWLLPAAPMLRPPHEVPSRKRAEHRRRSEFRQTLYVLACTRATSIAAKTWRGQHASTLVERCSDEGPVLTSRCQVDHIQR